MKHCYIVRLLIKIWISWNDGHICAKHWLENTWNPVGGIFGDGRWECSQCEMERDARWSEYKLEEQERHKKAVSKFNFKDKL